MFYLSAKRHRSVIWWEDALRRTFWATVWMTDYSIWFIGWVPPQICEGPGKNPSIWKESLIWIVPRIRSVRGWNLEGWRTGCRPWGVGDDGRIGNLLEKTQCERGDFSRRRIYFPVADGGIKPLRGDQDLRTSILIRQRPIQGESPLDFLGESEGSLPPPHDSFADAVEAINDFWSMSGLFIHRHHVEPRVRLYSPREESFTIPLKYIDVSRITHTNLDVKQERRIDDYWNIDGSRDLYVVRREIKEKTADIQARSLMARTPGRKWRRMPSWRRGKSGHMKSSTSITNEIWEGFISSTRRTRNLGDHQECSQEIGTPVALVMPCKIFRAIRIVGVVHPIKSKQNLRVVWKPVNPPECVWKNLYRIIMRTILQEKVTIHYSITISFTNLFLCLKPWKFPQQRHQWKRNGKNWRKFRRGTWRKSEVRKRWSMKQGRRAQRFISPHWWTCHLINAELEAKHQKYKGRVVLRGDIVKDNSGSYAVFTGQGSSASQMTAAKVMDIISRVPGCAGQTADAVSAFSKVKWKMLQNYWTFPNRKVQRFGFVYHDTNGLNHGPAWKTQSFLLKGMCMVIL